MNTRRVVVTGVGAISPLGTSFHETWSRLLRGECGVTTLLEAQQFQPENNNSNWNNSTMDNSIPLCPVVAPVRKTFESSRMLTRSVHFALVAAAEALEQAKLSSDWFGNDDDTSDTFLQRRYRAGVSLGCGMSSLRDIVDAAHTLSPTPPRRSKLSPYFVPKILLNSPAGQLSMRYKLQGPNLTSSTACAASAHAIGEAMHCIQYNRADIMLAGGTEACIDPLSLHGFGRLRALASGKHGEPHESSRPFDTLRDGFVMGEGSAILVLEELEHAQQRQQPVLAELVGYGATADAFHSTAPDPTGTGAERAMQMVFMSSRDDLSFAQVHYVNAHATSTPKGDEIEARAIDRMYLASNNSLRSKPLYVSSTKGATGHLLGAAGALEAAVTVQTLLGGRIPPTLNLDQPDADVQFTHVPGASIPINHPMELAMSNSFGFGGTNACLLFRNPALM